MDQKKIEEGVRLILEGIGEGAGEGRPPGNASACRQNV